jgi:YD repeat-containing protein
VAERSSRRPTGLPDNRATPVDWVKDVVYNAAGQITAIKSIHNLDTGDYRNEHRTYNVLGEVTHMHVDNQSNVLNRTYTYSTTQNDGRIEMMVDSVSGETVQYQYDSLKRLISAETTGTQWGQSFSYDGFGNLLAQTVTKGSAPSLSVLVSGTTNRITSAGYAYDSNGNLTAAPGLAMSYDVENRMVSVTRSGNGTEYYAYGPSNERVWKRIEYRDGFSYNFVYFYGVDGALLTTSGISGGWDCNV